MKNKEKDLSMGKSKTIIVAVVALIIGFGLAVVCTKANVFCAEKVIAYVDVQQIVSTSADLKKVQEKRKAQLEGLQAFVDNARKEVEALKDKSKERIALENKYNAELNVRKNALDKEFADALAAVDTKVSSVIKATAKKMGIEYVFPKAMMLAGGKDITSDVITALK